MRTIKLCSPGFNIMSLSVSQGCKSREASGRGFSSGFRKLGCDVESVVVAGGEHNAKTALLALLMHSFFIRWLRILSDALLKAVKRKGGSEELR